MDRRHCMVCKKTFDENESKTMSRRQDGFFCMKCDEKKNGGRRI